MGTPMNGESKLAFAAEQQVKRLIKAKAAPKWLPLALAFLMALMVAGGVGLGFVVNSVHSTQIASCEAGNKARATNVKIWDGFLTLLITDPSAAAKRTSLISSIASLNLPPSEVKAFDVLIDTIFNPNPADAKIVKQFEAYIAANEPQQNCG